MNSMDNILDIHSNRSKKARLSRKISRTGRKILAILAILLFAAGLFLIIAQISIRVGYLSVAVALILIMFVTWVVKDLTDIAIINNSTTIDGILEQSLLAGFSNKDLPVTPRKALEVALKQWQAGFIFNRLLIYRDGILNTVSDDSSDMLVVWEKAHAIAKSKSQQEINSGTLAYAILCESTNAMQYLISQNVTIDDVGSVFDWMSRINQHMKLKKPYFGGIGRDWASGFTPYLERFGQNISEGVEHGGEAYHTLAHADVLDSVVYNLGNNVSGVALVGESGTGKTALVHALAERLLEGRDQRLQHYQIISLNASLIKSSGGENLENLLLVLMAEAVRAGNIIIFLEDASLFFADGVGSFNAAKVLQPIMQNHQLKLLAAFTPNEYQRLKSQNESLSSSFTAITINQPDRSETIDIIEDSAITLEFHSGLMASFQAIKEAYTLSGQYMQDEAYPGKAISLLNQSAAYSQDKIITVDSVDMSVEKIKGVKVSVASQPEADMLLSLEDNIHQRMINQSRAVSVVSSSLRRSRAGVSSISKPIGSFLFLGPTGVGKTELAKSIAAVYFGDEHNMIRLDMSEYQQPNDVDRLLSDGKDGEQSLILAIRKQPFSVVLLDEIEKANPNILNLLLQMLDEGRLTDVSGKSASFTSAIIIATSNAGSAQITEKVLAGINLEEFERPLIDELINSGMFRPELINRFDEIVLFRPLNKDEIAQVANLMIDSLNKTLADKNIKIELTQAALDKLVEVGYDPQFGARPMRRAIQKMVEDVIANKILKQEIQHGQTLVLDVADLAVV